MDTKPEVSFFGIVMVFINAVVFIRVQIWDYEESKTRINPIEIFGNAAAKLGPFLTDLLVNMMILTNFLPVLVSIVHRRRTFKLFFTAYQEMNAIEFDVCHLNWTSIIIRLIISVANVIFLIWYSLGFFFELRKYHIISLGGYIRNVLIFYYKYLIIFDMMIGLAVVERTFNGIKKVLVMHQKQKFRKI